MMPPPPPDLVVHAVINCMIPITTLDAATEAIRVLCSLLEERTAVYNLKVVDPCSVGIVEATGIPADPSGFISDEFIAKLRERLDPTSN